MIGLRYASRTSSSAGDRLETDTVTWRVALRLGDVVCGLGNEVFGDKQPQEIHRPFLAALVLDLYQRELVLFNSRIFHRREGSGKNIGRNCNGKERRGR